MKIDLSDVDPLRWPEVRRRVETIRGFLSIKRPTPVQRDAHAAELGLSTKHFMRLVAVWKAHGQARMIDADGGKGRPRAARNRLSAETRAAIAEAITALGHDAGPTEVTRLAKQFCHERDAPAPSRSAVWNAIMAARAEGITVDCEGSSIVIGRVSAKLPVEVDGEVAYPAIDLAVLAPEGVILAHTVTVPPAPLPDRESLLGRVAGMCTTGARIRTVENTIDNGGSDLEAGAAKNTAAQSGRLATLLGRGPAPVRLIYRPRSATPARKLSLARHDRPIGFDDARKIIASAIERHNQQRRPDGVPAFSVA